MASNAAPLASVRVDIWLFSTRLFKTRQIAVDAINAGRVVVNDERIKPSKVIKPGDTLLVRKPPYEWRIVVNGLAEKRGSAKVAEAMYTETPASIALRESLRKELKAAPPPIFPGRPTKKDRRTIDKFFAHQVGHDDSPS